METPISRREVCGACKEVRAALYIVDDETTVTFVDDVEHKPYPTGKVLT